MAGSNGIIAIGAALGALMMPGTAAAAPARQPPRSKDCAQSAAAAQAKPAPQRWRYCITMEITGSRVSKRVCRTMAQWKEQGVDPLAL